MSSFMNRGNVPAKGDAAFQIPYIQIIHGGTYDVPEKYSTVEIEMKDKFVLLLHLFYLP